MQFAVGNLVCITIATLAGAFAQSGNPTTRLVLPRAEDVLPRGEVSKGSLVVSGDGYRFQIRPEFKPVAHPRGNPAYSGILDGFLEPAEITMYATRRRFTGGLDALVGREIEAVAAKNGKISFNTPVKIHIAGELALAHRFLATVEGRLDLHVLAVHQGSAYVLHVETPLQPSKLKAFANMGSDLMIRGSTFHVAPPDPVGSRQVN